MERYELSSALAASRSFVDHVAHETGVHVSDCYQCGKCSAGCPFAFAMDYMPHQVIRMLQLGLYEQALKSRSIWICAGCAACYTRCPREVDLPRLMETLRIEAKKAGFVGEKTVDIFADIFLGSVEKNGRVHEVGLAAMYNLRSGRLFQDVLKSPSMFLKGKLSLWPEKIKDRRTVGRIFSQTRMRR